VSLRARLTLAAAGAVALAVLAASIGVYFVVRAQLRGEVDSSLRQRASLIQSLPANFELPSRASLPKGVPQLPSVPPATLGGPSGYLQLVSAAGKATRPGGGSVEVPVTARTIAVARGGSGAFMYDATIAGTHVRVLAAPLRKGVALQLVRPLDEVDAVLSRLRWILLAVMVTGVAVAAALGAAVSRTALRPVRQLTETAESVSTTLNLSERIEATGRDEIGRLGASFNRMLEALEGSVSAQRQLVADASHELRTPLTSLRVNVETLLRSDRLPADERARLGDDVVEQLGEMTVLIDEVVEVARGDTQPLRRERVELDDVVEAVVERRRRDSPAVEIVVKTKPVVVEGDRLRIERAVANLVENACKWSPRGGTVEVRLGEDGRLFVRDDGPGFDENDLPHVFDRFYRSADARSLPGSGLGLAIVRQVAETHHGWVTAANRPGGGAVLCLALPLETS
jgi:two-component system, OmpR family, sensor histidine kinase MprB